MASLYDLANPESLGAMTGAPPTPPVMPMQQSSGLQQMAESMPAPRKPVNSLKANLQSFTSDLMFTLAQSFAAGPQRGAGLAAALSGPTVRKTLLAEQAEKEALRAQQMQKVQQDMAQTTQAMEKQKQEMNLLGIREVKDANGVTHLIRTDPLTYKQTELGTVGTPEKKERKTTTINDRLVDSQTGEVIKDLSEPPKDTEGQTGRRLSAAFYRNKHKMSPDTKLDDLQQAEADAEYDAYKAGLKPSGQTGGKKPLTETSEARLIGDLSKTWKAATTPAIELDRQVKMLDTGLNAARRGDMAQGAQVILVTFQKVLDPPSVVRESEYMRSASGQSLMNRVRGYLEQLQKGGAGISVAELEKFAKLAKEAATAQSKGYLDSEKKRIGKVADRYEIPHELIFQDFNFGSTEEPRTGGVVNFGDLPK